MKKIVIKILKFFDKLLQMSNFFAKHIPNVELLDDGHRTYPNFLQMLNFFDKSWMS